jgi:catechol 2,3-dioxygenase-like lactoylglutathione lyase family enzyme
MMRLGSVILGAHDVDQAVRFWQAATGYRIHRFDGSANEFTLLIPPDGVGTRIGIQRSDTEAQARPRTHLDFIVETAQEQRSEVERLVDLGGGEVEWEYDDDADFVVVEDPDGNRFCVVNMSGGQENGA